MTGGHHRAMIGTEVVLDLEVGTTMIGRPCVEAQEDLEEDHLQEEMIIEGLPGLGREKNDQISGTGLMTIGKDGTMDRPDTTGLLKNSKEPGDLMTDLLLQETMIGIEDQEADLQLLSVEQARLLHKGKTIEDHLSTEMVVLQDSVVTGLISKRGAEVDLAKQNLALMVLAGMIGHLSRNEVDSSQEEATKTVMMDPLVEDSNGRIQTSTLE